MHFLVSKSFHLLLISSLLLLSQDPITAVDPLFTVCPSDASNYTSGSQFETNLNRLLPSLSPNGSINLTGYYNATYGEDPNIVYGYSQCMTGATEEDCRACLKNSTVEIIQRCPNKRQAIIRYYNCILRYSYQSIPSERDTTFRLLLYRVENTTNATTFNQQLGSLMKDLTLKASSKPSKFATGSVDLTDFQNLYGLAQCTRDLSESDCTACLQVMINQIPVCCGNKTGGNIYSVSCNIRYDPYLFFDISPEISPPPLPASTPPSTPPSETNRKTDTRNGDEKGMFL
ncbi:cysteine-rich repeat secretory protein 38-like [Magnolia sinica]|uniref:cysteine-rich repeat secretory protein 38-like n=1 Tax=Magnolia sinica TaxID=86752 RepID=UPI00265A8D50|nr:cysteine-rich repeat secretory protein 38-like [Magnolia sinica]